MHLRVVASTENKRHIRQICRCKGLQQERYVLTSFPATHIEYVTGRNLVLQSNLIDPLLADRFGKEGLSGLIDYIYLPGRETQTTYQIHPGVIADSYNPVGVRGGHPMIEIAADISWRELLPPSRSRAVVNRVDRVVQRQHARTRAAPRKSEVDGRVQDV